MRILCVAGNREVAYLIKHVLEFEGHETIVARSVDEAAEQLDERPDLLVLVPPLPGGGVDPADRAGRLGSATVPFLVLRQPVEPDALVEAIRRAEAPRGAGAVEAAADEASGEGGEARAVSAGAAVEVSGRA